MKLLNLILVFVLGALCNPEIGLAQNANFLKNPSFNSGLVRWTASGGAYTKETVLQGTGESSGKWDPSATSQTFKSELVEVPALNKGKNCYAEINYSWETGTSGHLEMYVEDQTATRINSEALIVEPSVGTWRPTGIAFICPATGTIRIVLESTADADAIILDQTHLGEDFRRGESTIVAGKAQEAFTESDIPMIGGVIIGETISVEETGYYSIYAQSQFSNSPTGTGIDRAVQTNIYINGVEAAGSGSYNLLVDAATSVDYAHTAYTIHASLNASDVVTLRMSSTNVTGAVKSIWRRMSITPIKDPNDPGTAPTVTLETQGWFVDATLGGDNINVGLVTNGTYSVPNASNLDLVLKSGSKNAAVPCSSGNEAQIGDLTCTSGSEQPGIVVDIPYKGTFKVCASFSHKLEGSGDLRTSYQIALTGNADDVVVEAGSDKQLNWARVTNEMGYPNRLCGQFTIESGKRTFKLFNTVYAASAASTNRIEADRTAVNGAQEMRWSVLPLTQNFPQAIALTNLVAPDVASCTADKEICVDTTYVPTLTCSTNSSNCAGPFHVITTKMGPAVRVSLNFQAQMDPSAGTFARINLTNMPFVSGSFPSSQSIHGSCIAVSDSNNHTGILKLEGSGTTIQGRLTDDFGISVVLNWTCQMTYLSTE